MRGEVLCAASLVLAVGCGGSGDDRGSGSGDDGLTTLGSGTEADDSNSDSNSGGTAPKLDNPVEVDLGVGNCGGDGGGASGGGMDDDEDGEIDFSYIWIANSVESTISKIDTQTLVEEGRYLTRPDSNGNPSRTSVNLSGDVAVANRNGGVTKFLAVAEECPDLNSNGVIETATGAGTLGWGLEECMAWHTPMPYESQRPVAWAGGDWNPSTCDYDNQKLWTSGATAANGVDVLYLDGETGVIEQTVKIPEIVYDGFGIYGAAVDGEGNFWGSQLSGGKLVYVNVETFVHQSWDIPIAGYGMTVDHDGYVWICASQVARFDPMTQMFATAQAGGSGGCMEDGNGTLWLANNPMVGVDTTTMQVVQSIQLGSYVHGVSIDFYGYVWGVTLQEPFAYRADPATGTYDTFTGLNGPYTYSDMTGFALKNAGTIPTPAG